VHPRLVGGDRITTLELDRSLRVTLLALLGDLTELLGPGCLGDR
jgi:DNA polymerase-3 subunit alpha